MQEYKDSLLLHEAQTLYHTTRPVQPPTDGKPEDFRDIGTVNNRIYAQYRNTKLFRVTPILKNNKRGISKYYSFAGQGCYTAPKAKRWFQQLQQQEAENLRRYEASIAAAAQHAKETGTDVNAAIEAAHHEFFKQNPGFSIQL
jgi:hypothetical protein